MKIYASYDEEPQEQYEALTPSLYQELYDLEMTGFTDDLPFYLAALTPSSGILELGCGSGRLSRQLAGAGHQVVITDAAGCLRPGRRSEVQLHGYAPPRLRAPF
jgi:2-polyprenyl-3-methyl-5-hydroxy-6-metoxy-1,4-benzoquinol methylase